MSITSSRLLFPLCEAENFSSHSTDYGNNSDIVFRVYFQSVKTFVLKKDLFFDYENNTAFYVTRKISYALVKFVLHYGLFTLFF